MWSFLAGAIFGVLFGAGLMVKLFVDLMDSTSPDEWDQAFRNWKAKR